MGSGVSGSQQRGEDEKKHRQGAPEVNAGVLMVKRLQALAVHFVARSQEVTDRVTVVFAEQSVHWEICRKQSH